MKVLYFECYSGISGDMTLGALLDAGVDADELKNELGKLNLEGYSIQIKKGIKKGITGTDVTVIVEDQDKNHYHTHADNGTDHHHHHHHDIHRSYKQIKGIIENSDISQRAKDISISIFEKLAKAEGKIHNKPYEEVHFHEVGAVDSIVDIVGTGICLDIISPDMIICSNINVGGGMVRCQHGMYPVPAPATLELLKGSPIYSKGASGELVTPTGAAILAAVCDEYMDFPSMVVQKIGYGMGKKDFETPNCLRVCIGESVKK